MLEGGLQDSLYNSFTRHLSVSEFAYPSAEASLIAHVSKEAFIAAVTVSDGNLQLEVMKCKPPNVDAMLSHAIKVEAFEQSLACQGTFVTDQDDGQAKCWSPVVCVVLNQSDSSETVALHR